MVARGPKPKSPHLRLVEGHHRPSRHGSKTELRAKAKESAKAFGPIGRAPAYLKGPALEAWKTFIVPAAWLDGAAKASAIIFCELWGAYRKNPSTYPASHLREMRALQAQLGLTDERNRKPVKDPKTKRNPFFDDDKEDLFD
jgi:phage terminase small subunit